MTKKYPAILSKFYNTPLLVTQDKLLEINAFLERRLAGDQVAFEFDAKTGQPQTQLVAADSGEVVSTSRDLSLSDVLGQLAADTVPATSSAPRAFVAVLPLFGTIFQHGGLEMEISGGVSTDAWAKDLRRLDANPAVKTVIVETHSPGGQCYGTLECAETVRQIREAGRTRVVSVANSMMASAAVWIGTGANEVYVTPGGEIGSVGVVSIHTDFSEFDKNAGVKYTLIATSRKKIQGNEFEPLDDEARAQIEADNLVVYQKFLAGMAANRRTSVEKVEANFGGGGMLWADDAVKAGLADGVATMAEVLERELGRLKGAGRKSVRNKLAIEQAK